MSRLLQEVLQLEKRYRYVVGVDEVGRGPLAGPVVAAACWMDYQKIRQDPFVDQVRDSKALSPKKREEVYDWLRRSPHVEIGLAAVEAVEIDRLNILRASLLAMECAVQKIVSMPECVFVDGKYTFPCVFPIQAVVGGDVTILAVSAASIAAKVERDRIVSCYQEKYPLYGFAQHKGYPTRFHRDALQKYGPIPSIHRMTFAPVRNYAS